MGTVSLEKCEGEACQLKPKCERFTSPPLDVQAWGIYDEARFKQYGHMYACDHFVDNKPRGVAIGKV